MGDKKLDEAELEKLLMRRERGGWVVRRISNWKEEEFFPHFSG